MLKRNPHFPKASIYGLIGGIPETFGGRTSVCLQRANAIAELDERHVEILTLSPKNGVDTQALTERLREEGRIGNRVAIRNVWADLRHADAHDLLQIAGNNSQSITVDPTQLPAYDGSPEILEVDSAGKTIRADRFREDGTRYNSYRPGDLDTKKSSVLFDLRGRPIAQWAEQYELYFAWMDWLIGTEPAIIINDGPPLARYLHKYQRANVVLVQTIHSKHSADPTKRTHRLGWTYTPALKNVDRFDHLAVLTESQRSDLSDLNYVMDNASVLPNMTTAEPIKRIKPRKPGAGVMLARTTFLKRIDHAITAVHKAQQTGVDATFDIYGVADEAQESLEALIAEIGVGDTIRLRGFDPRAKSKFEESSFTLLTSEYEGQPLVLLESMAVGCIPIAYDIKYGPADIITHGVNGFLVSPGDVDAMAKCIGDLHSMAEPELLQIRKAAIKRAQDFSPEKITRMWGRMLNQAVDNKVPPRQVEGKAQLVDLVVDGNEMQLTVKITGDAAKNPTWSLLTWTERNGKRFGRLPAHGEEVEGQFMITASALADDFASIDRGFVDLWIDLRTDGQPCRLRIKGAQALEPTKFAWAELYSTKFGSLSIRYDSPHLESATESPQVN
ncbi:glycosyltransferase [Brevibacterium zhoupengii]|uniref:glycosyltransferase n=1 Tax=Brevibacterium zhoupengii TaxID=2898795 RepID=UPI001E55E416|nr:glycosyltransferase [Brevibacterium zhoupengii]